MMRQQGSRNLSWPPRGIERLLFLDHPAFVDGQENFDFIGKMPIEGLRREASAARDLVRLRGIKSAFLKLESRRRDKRRPRGARIAPVV